MAYMFSAGSAQIYDCTARWNSSSSFSVVIPSGKG